MTGGPSIPPSSAFWESLYERGGISGTGSRGRLAQFKAEIMNGILATHDIQSVIELGCGDGQQVSLIDYPDYLGLDTSATAVEMCRARFADDPTRRFRSYVSGEDIPETADMTVSLDVVYHLLEDETYLRYMSDLFGAAARLVVVYSSDTEEPSEWPEVRHRHFTKWVEEHEPAWRLHERIPNRFPYVAGDPTTSWADFFVYSRS